MRVTFVRSFGVALMGLLLAALVGACGSDTATVAAVATTAAPTTAAATTAAMVSPTTAAATTAAMMSPTTAAMMSPTTAAMMSPTTAAMMSPTTAAMMSPTTAAGTTAASGTPAGTTAAPVGNTVVAGTPVGTANGNAKISLTTLKLGAIPAENATTVLNNTKPFAAALSAQLGIPVTVYVGNNYTAVIEALSSGKIDVAIFGPFSYVLAADKYGAKVIALQTGTDGSKSYNSLIVTKKTSGITTVAGLKGHSFSYVDPASTSGNLIPRYTLIKAGLDPDKDVKGIFAGGHDASLLGVASGKTDAGAVASDTFAKLTSPGDNNAPAQVNKDDILIINTSDPIPDSPVAVRKDLSDADTAILKAAMLAVKDADALKTLGTAGYVDNSDSNYNTLRDIAKAENLDLTKLK